MALDVKQFDEIVEACESNGVQFMDNTMWVHNPRTNAMAEFLNNANRFGQLKSVIVVLLFNAGAGGGGGVVLGKWEKCVYDCLFV